MANQNAVPCPQCGGNNLFAATTAANSSDGPSLLPGLGRLFHAALMDVVVCADCGQMRFYARTAERERLVKDADWQRI